MSYTLLGSWTSPFVRPTRLYMLINKIDFEFKAIDYFGNAQDAEYLAQINPLNKIPLLKDGNEKIFESRIIFNYLRKKHELPELSLDEENILSVIIGAMDTSINLFMYKRGGLELSLANFYVRRQQARIPEALKYISAWVESLDSRQARDWNYLSMTLYSYLAWTQFRQALDLVPFPIMQKFLADFKNAPGLIETDGLK